MEQSNKVTLCTTHNIDINEGERKCMWGEHYGHPGKCLKRSFYFIEAHLIGTEKKDGIRYVYFKYEGSNRLIRINFDECIDNIAYNFNGY